MIEEVSRLVEMVGSHFDDEQEREGFYASLLDEHIEDDHGALLAARGIDPVFDRVITSEFAETEES